MSGLASVLRVIRPAHFLKALLHPLEELEAFKYHYRRVSASEFVGFLAPEASPAAVEEIRRQLSGHTAFKARLDSELKIHGDGYGGQMTREAPAIYSLVRLLKPRVVVETGVADGVTSSYILRALEDNGEGKLYSIDLPSGLLPVGRLPGWIVEEALRKRWDLRVGDAAELLPTLLKELGEIDMFLHDSLHTYGHMTLEYRAAWPRLKTGGLFLSHDVGQNKAFFDFMKERGIGWGQWRVLHVLGGLRKIPA
ncbi:MAG: hypothetical protein CVU79_02245 [Elusimicrobia bacterium HGW-Elusimicrobia-3]|jgi:predicted O-methyltransferase YrrM|nr:MAG: hypothetical protein CVU79_02245 [Elusimicrobia bacterium HGW-Elusimicrobia-3]